MIFLIAFGVFVLFFLLMALGLMIKKKPLKGSCGGVATLMGNKDCDICGGDPNKCETVQDQPKVDTHLFKDASQTRER